MKVGFNLSAPEAQENSWPEVFKMLTLSGNVVGLFVTKVLSPAELHATSDGFAFLQDCSFSGELEENIDREALAAANRFWQSEEADRFRLVAMKLLNRVDYYGTFRLLDREVVLTLAVLRAFAALRANPVDLLVFEVTPHEFNPYVLQVVAKASGVKTISFEPSPISPTLIPHGVELPRAATVQSSSIASEILKIATDRVKALRGLEVPRYLALQLRRDAQLNSRSARMRARMLSLRWLFRPRFADTTGSFSGHDFKTGLVKRIGEILLNRSLEQNLRRQALASEGLEKGFPSRFALFALHYEPERTSLPDGLPILFQGDAVLMARDILPSSLELVVKEHYSQTSAALRGYLGRSPLFYKYLSVIPGVRAVRGDGSATDHIGRAECVFTLTGTIALESVFMGVPVAYFGSPWWEGLPGTRKVDDFTTWTDVKTVAMPSGDTAQQFLEQLVMDRTIPGIASQNQQFVENRMGQLPHGFFAAEAAALTECIEVALAGVRSEK